MAKKVGPSKSDKAAAAAAAATTIGGRKLSKRARQKLSKGGQAALASAAPSDRKQALAKNDMMKMKTPAERQIEKAEKAARCAPTAQRPARLFRSTFGVRVRRVRTRALPCARCTRSAGTHPWALCRHLARQEKMMGPVAPVQKKKARRGGGGSKDGAWSATSMHQAPSSKGKKAENDMKASHPDDFERAGVDEPVPATADPKTGLMGYVRDQANPQTTPTCCARYLMRVLRAKEQTYREFCGRAAVRGAVPRRERGCREERAAVAADHDPVQGAAGQPRTDFRRSRHVRQGAHANWQPTGHIRASSLRVQRGRRGPNCIAPSELAEGGH